MGENMYIVISFITVVALLLGTFTAILSFIRTERNTSNFSIVCLLVSSFLLMFVWLDYRDIEAKKYVYEQVKEGTLKDSSEYKHWLIDYEENNK